MTADFSQGLTYGADKGGLVCGFRFTPGNPGRAVDSDAAAELIAPTSTAEDEFIWLHFNLADIASRRWLDQRLPLPESFFDSLKTSTPTRLELLDDSLLAVIRDVRFFAFEASEASSVSVWVTPRLFVSARSTPLRSVDRLRASVRAGETFRSSVELLAHLLADQADVLANIVRDATQRVDQIEDHLIEDRAGRTRPQLGALRRTLVRLQRLLAPEPAALFRLLNRPPAWVDPDDRRDLRQSAEMLSAAVADCAALVERVRLLQEEHVALVNERTGRTLFVLTVVTVMALPITVTSSLFGMNVGGVPLASNPNGFWTVTLLVTMVTLVGLIWAFSARSR